jgi:fermentation-respiration switch protein FrsA (DUF1100 family)
LRNSTSRHRGETRIRGFVLKLLIAAAVAYCAIVGILFAAQRYMLFPGAVGGPVAAGHWGDLVELRTGDGETLAALHLEAPSGRPTILLLHGNADRADRYGFLADLLAARRIGLLAVSYRGYPGSTGRPDEAGLIADGEAGFDWLAARSNGPVVLLGRSLGSGVAVGVAATRRVAGLVLVSAYDSVLAVAQETYFFVPVAPFLKDPFRSDQRIASVKAPILFIHGRRDTLIPLSHGERLFVAAPGPKTMVVLEEAGHNDIWSEPALEALIAFAERAK